MVEAAANARAPMVACRDCIGSPRSNFGPVVPADRQHVRDAVDELFAPAADTATRPEEGLL
jgi:hypothetical protein